MTTIINLTQHAATPEQVAAGVVDLSPEKRKELSQLLTFDNLPVKGEVEARAKALADFAAQALKELGLRRVGAPAMIGGAPFLMVHLHLALIERRVHPMYAFSVRESVETTLPDGKVVKTAVFKHGGFVEA